jgi:serine/threonine-protein kinase RsbW
MPSRRAAVGPTVEKILRSVRRAHLSEEQRADLAVAVAEALSNAAVHGNALRPGTRVDVRVETKPDGETIVRVRDSGPGFDVRRVSDPTNPSQLLLPRGRGVFIMRKLVDKVEYNDAGNVVSLKFRPRRPARGRGPSKR